MAVTITIVCDKCGAQESWQTEPVEGKLSEEALPSGWQERRFLMESTKVVKRLYCPLCNEKLRPRETEKEPPSKYEEKSTTRFKTRFAHFDQ